MVTRKLQNEIAEICSGSDFPAELRERLSGFSKKNKIDEDRALQLIKDFRLAINKESTIMSCTLELDIVGDILGEELLQATNRVKEVAKELTSFLTKKSA